MNTFFIIIFILILYLYVNQILAIIYLNKLTIIKVNIFINFDKLSYYFLLFFILLILILMWMNIIIKLLFIFRIMINFTLKKWFIQIILIMKRLFYLKWINFLITYLFILIFFICTITYYTNDFFLFFLCFLLI